MRELTWDLFVTLDGYAKGTRSSAFFGYDGPGLQAWIAEQAGTPHLLVMGGGTYRALVEYGPVTDRPQVVISRSLDEPLAWANAALVRDDAVDAITAMKRDDGEPLRLIGSLSVGRSLLVAGLVDRYRLVGFPRILGDTGAEPAFAGLPDLTVELDGVQVLDGRVVVSTYRPIAPGPGS